MRVFQHINEAVKEIRRDISKSPLVYSSRVQNKAQVDGKAHEALAYAYTLLDVPLSVEGIAQVAAENGFVPKEEVEKYKHWLTEEHTSRLNWRPHWSTEELNSNLATVIEGNEPSYTYTDRLRGAIETLEEVLAPIPDSRRAFWPIYVPEDAVRAPRFTRIPCSIGYQALIRDIGDQQFLHLVYLQRSCDFNKFWISDVWFARHFQLALYDRLREEIDTLELGHLTHFIISFHAFISGEIY